VNYLTSISADGPHAIFNEIIFWDSG